jgi:transposase
MREAACPEKTSTQSSASTPIATPTRPRSRTQSAINSPCWSSPPTRPVTRACSRGWLSRCPAAECSWAIEGTRSHGAGLCRALAAVGAQITEVDRPTRRARRAGKRDPIDALLAARAALAADYVRQPRTDGDREAARLLLVERDRLVRHRTAVLNQMRDLVLTAPEELRHRLRDRSIAGLIAACSALRPRSSDAIETRVRVQVTPAAGPPRSSTHRGREDRRDRPEGPHHRERSAALGRAGDRPHRGGAAVGELVSSQGPCAAGSQGPGGPDPVLPRAHIYDAAYLRD